MVSSFANLLEEKKDFTLKRVKPPHDFISVHQHGRRFTVSYINMDAFTSRENARIIVRFWGTAHLPLL